MEAQTVIKEEQKNKNRFKYAFAFVTISTTWLFLVALITVAQGFNLWGFELEPATLKFLLGTTTLNVLGPYFLIAKYLFNGSGQKKD